MSFGYSLRKPGSGSVNTTGSDLIRVQISNLAKSILKKRGCFDDVHGHLYVKWSVSNSNMVLNHMVIQIMLGTCEGKQIFVKNILIFFYKFATSVDLIKCLKLSKPPSSLLTCAPASESPSYILPCTYIFDLLSRNPTF